MQIWEITISTLAGFMTAFLAEPIKIHFVNQSRRRQFRKALFRELIQNYSQLQFISDKVYSGQMNLSSTLLALNRISSQVYLAVKNDPFMFYELEEAIDLDILYNNFDLLKNLPITPHSIAEDDLKTLLEYINAAIFVFYQKATDGSLNMKLIEKALKNTQKHALQDIIKQNQPQ